MTTVNVPNVHHKSVLKYIKDFTVHSPQQYGVIVESDYTCLFIPDLGEWSFQYEDITIAVSYKEEGRPISAAGEPSYFTRLLLSTTSEDSTQLKEFITKAVTYERDAENSRKIRIFTGHSRGYFANAGSIFTQTLEHIFIPPPVKADIVRTIDKFLVSKERYQTFGRLYKTSFLLTGVPGAGKTSLVKALALKYKRPVYILSFTKQLTDESLIDLMGELKEDAILLIEDIDAFFVDRQPVNINISFSAFINFLDGMLGRGNGVMIFMTANNPDRLDHALIRPGRVDKIIKFDYPKKREIQAAFDAMVSDVQPGDFESFYDNIKHHTISMSGIIDYLFRNVEARAVLDNIEELLGQTNLVNEIVSDKIEKLYH
jgi:chaperone BCS1